jgi:hypothetical protein
MGLDDLAVAEAHLMARRARRFLAAMANTNISRPTQTGIFVLFKAAGRIAPVA